MLVRTPAEEGGWEEAEQRTRAELEAAGFAVELATLVPGTDIIGLAKTHGAFAAIKVSRPIDESTGITVHVVDRVTGKSTTRTLDAKKDGQTPERVAIRAVELLYASLLELQTAAPFEGEVRATPLIEAAASQQLMAPSDDPELGLAWRSLRVRSSRRYWSARRATRGGRLLRLAQADPRAIGCCYRSRDHLHP